MSRAKLKPPENGFFLPPFVGLVARVPRLIGRLGFCVEQLKLAEHVDDGAEQFGTGRGKLHEMLRHADRHIRDKVNYAIC